MPSIFKALASITAWTFFIVSWVTGLSTFVMGITTGALYGSEPPPIELQLGFALSIAWGLSAVVVMILRQKME